MRYKDILTKEEDMRIQTLNLLDAPNEKSKEVNRCRD